ncbi:MAG: type II methionyl aminopeptidase [Candidatus Pacearchaeota archaeon]
MELNKEKILKAGKITKETRDYAKTIVKKGVPLLEIAEKIEAKIESLGGKPAFPTNLSINEVAAHYTPGHDDKTLAHGLIKVDFGVHFDGFTADNSISFDLENSEENKKLISAAEEALKKAIEIVKVGVSANKIGKVIQDTIESKGFTPIINLSGHSMEQYELHAGVTIPNIDDGRGVILKEGLYAIEPFTTAGSGKVRDGRHSGIYNLQNTKKPRSQTAREILDFIEKEYNTLPFCSRWIVKKFGPKALFALNELELNGNLHQYDQLVEISGKPVGQAEHTILVEKDKVTVTTI